MSFTQTDQTYTVKTMSYSDRFCQKIQFNPNNNRNKAKDAIWMYKWEIFYRLQALEIACSCNINESLKIESNNIKTAIQVWSVTKQYGAPRQELVCWLERCWQIENYRNNSNKY